LYADDTTAFVTGKNEDEAVSLLNILFAEISQWCKKNKLTIHPTKCKAMIISRNTFIGPLKPVKWGDTTLDYIYTNTTKDLEVNIDN
jgi:hypothetical protein